MPYAGLITPTQHTLRQYPNQIYSITITLGYDSSDIWWGRMGLRMREKERYEKEALEHLVSMG